MNDHLHRNTHRVPLLEVEDLKKHFPIHKGLLGRQTGEVKAVDGVSFQVFPRETLGMVGESGCGKTTVGRTILRLIEPTAGSATFDGKNIFTTSRPELRAMRRDMQIIFQDPYSSLNPRMTVGSIIGDALELHGIATGDARFERAKELLERVGLQASYINRYPHEFSGGQRQRIGIARAVALRPKFIVCDEAVSALDVSVQAQILNLLGDLQEEYQLSYLFIAHDLAVVRHIADRVAVMYLGRIVELSPCDDLFENPLHPYTQALLSAIPHPVPRRKKGRILLKGDVPNPISPPSGCHFHTRCPLVEDRCRVEAPQAFTARQGHYVCCHLYEGMTTPVEPILIGGRPSEQMTPSPAKEAVDPAAQTLEWGSTPAVPFDSLTEEGNPRSARTEGDPSSMALPKVLAGREGMVLGPFGEIIDPEEEFISTGDIPTLDSITGQHAPVAVGEGELGADEYAPTERAEAPSSVPEEKGLAEVPTERMDQPEHGTDAETDPTQRNEAPKPYWEDPTEPIERPEEIAAMRAEEPEVEAPEVPADAGPKAEKPGEEEGIDPLGETSVVDSLSDVPIPAKPDSD